MNAITDLLTNDRIRSAEAIHSKKRALERSAELLCESNPELDSAAVFECLLGRERLGSTGLGHGVAIPHGRLAGCSKPVGAFMSLSEGIDYDAIDQQPVDMIFALLVPEQATQAHLDILSQLARLFSDADKRQQLRLATTPEQLLATLTE